MHLLPSFNAEMSTVSLRKKKSNLRFYTSPVSRAKTLQNKQYIYTTITLQTRNLKRQMPNFGSPRTDTTCTNLTHFYPIRHKA